jgi:HEAT repeat protein
VRSPGFDPARTDLDATNPDATNPDATNPDATDLDAADLDAANLDPADLTAATGDERDRADASTTAAALSVRDVVVAGHQGVVGIIRRALGHPDPELRRTGLGAAARSGLLDEALLLEALTDADTGVRRRAVELAGRRPPSAALRARLLTALDDEDEVAEMAAFSLGEWAEDTPGVAEALSRVARQHPDALCREAAVAGLGAVGAGLAAILDALARDRATVRRRAVLALAPFDGPEVDDALQRALDDRDWQVRQAAEDLLQP